MAGSLSKLRHYATGGEVGWGGPDEQLPGGTPKASGRTYTPLSTPGDYYTYGKGPEHQFFTGSLPTLPLRRDVQTPQTPTVGTSNATTGGLASLAAILELQKAGKTLEGGWNQLKGLFGGNSDEISPVKTSVGKVEVGTGKPVDGNGWWPNSGSLSDGMGMNDAGGALTGLYSLTQDEGKFAGAASGAASGMQLAGWPGAIVGGALGYIQEAGFGDGNPWDASGFGGMTMDAAWEDQNLPRLASNPVGALASLAGIDSESTVGKILDPSGWFSKHGDEKRNMKAFTAVNPVRDLGGGKYALPDGTPVSKKQLEWLAGTWYGATYAPDGDQEGWQKKFAQAMQDIYGGKAEGGEISGEFITATRPGGQLANLVRGPGTGRSDEIPARLSAGEYVFDAETVALLGDGSTDAGARKLDQLREKLRAHKGAKLAKGKFSDNAKDPLEYLGE
jgi:hypothetical protein